MSKNINGTEFTTFDDLWNDPSLLTQAEKDDIQLKIDRLQIRKPSAAIQKHGG